MTKQEFENWVISKRYSKDKFGHYQRTEDNGFITRLRVKSDSVIYEREGTLFDSSEWVRLASGYYKNLSITPEGKLAGMKR